MILSPIPAPRLTQPEPAPAATNLVLVRPASLRGGQQSAQPQQQPKPPRPRQDFSYPKKPPPAPSGGANPLDTPGSGVSIWRELVRGLSNYGLGALDPKMNAFSPENRALLGPRFQNKK